MTIQICIYGDEAGDETRSLARWLRDSDDMSEARITLVHTSGQRSGEMGSATEIIQAIFQPQGVLVALAGALGTWIGSRRKPVTIHVRSGEKEVQIDSAKFKEPEEVAARLLRNLSDL